MGQWHAEGSTCYSQACENNGYFSYFAIGRLLYSRLLDKDQQGREIEEPAPEILGSSRILSEQRNGGGELEGIWIILLAKFPVVVWMPHDPLFLRNYYLKFK